MKLNNTSKVLLIMVALFIISITTYSIGLSRGTEQGKQYVLDNQIVFDEGGMPGYYYSVLDNEKYNYWYENGQYTDPRVQAQFNLLKLKKRGLMT